MATKKQNLISTFKEKIKDAEKNDFFSLGVGFIYNGIPVKLELIDAILMDNGLLTTRKIVVRFNPLLLVEPITYQNISRLEFNQLRKLILIRLTSLGEGFFTGLLDEIYKRI